MTILTRKVTSLCSSIYKVESTDKSCLQRQVSEGANLAACDADNILNSHTEYHQPRAGLNGVLEGLAEVCLDLGIVAADDMVHVLHHSLGQFHLASVDDRCQDVVLGKLSIILKNSLPILMLREKGGLNQVIWS